MCAAGGRPRRGLAGVAAAPLACLLSRRARATAVAFALTATTHTLSPRHCGVGLTIGTVAVDLRPRSHLPLAAAAAAALLVTVEEVWSVCHWEERAPLLCAALCPRSLFLVRLHHTCDPSASLVHAVA